MAKRVLSSASGLFVRENGGRYVAVGAAAEPVGLRKDKQTDKAEALAELKKMRARAADLRAEARALRQEIEKGKEGRTMTVKSDGDSWEARLEEVARDLWARSGGKLTLTQARVRAMEADSGLRAEYYKSRELEQYVGAMDALDALAPEDRARLEKIHKERREAQEKEFEARWPSIAKQAAQEAPEWEQKLEKAARELVTEGRAPTIEQGMVRAMEENPDIREEWGKSRPR